MERLNKSFLILLACALPTGCGVKGMPLPPLTPAPIGRGEPTYSEATKSKDNKKKTGKSQDAIETPSETQEGL